MSGNPFFSLDETNAEPNETEMMIFPHVDKAIYDRRKKMAGTVVDYKEMRMRYSCAIKEVRTKFDVLNSEFNVRYQRNPITSISSRLKSSSSIMNKLARKKLNFTLENVENNLYDVAGIRFFSLTRQRIWRWKYKSARLLWISGQALSISLSINRKCLTRKKLWHN